MNDARVTLVASWTVKPAGSLLTSVGVKEAGSIRVGRRDAEVMICEWGSEATSGSPVEKTDLNQVWFDDLFDRIFLLMNGRGNRAQTNRTTTELLDDRQQ